MRDSVAWAFVRPPRHFGAAARSLVGEERKDEYSEMNDACLPSFSCQADMVVAIFGGPITSYARSSIADEVAIRKASASLFVPCSYRRMSLSGRHRRHGHIWRILMHI